MSGAPSLRAKGEAIHARHSIMDCRVAAFLAMTATLRPFMARRIKAFYSHLNSGALPPLCWTRP